MVEQVVAAVQRVGKQDQEEAPNEDMEKLPWYEWFHQEKRTCRILPYRAGYETEDRQEIQKSLERGSLSGVVSTSALELGLDIGEIGLVALLGVPPSMKAFWQRVGRAGRRNPGVCLLIDTEDIIERTMGGLERFVQRRIEPNWLYLENRYIQYANALCTAYELTEYPGAPPATDPFNSLPGSFRGMLENELNPTEIVPSDLYPLKQRGQAGPHREFPIRSSVEQNFQVKTRYGQPLGSLTFSQSLREAYPGAIYHYMAHPFRVRRFDMNKGEIYVQGERHWTTRPLTQTRVFPRFNGGILAFSKSNTGFIAETEMQVSERVLGFVEKRGGAQPIEHRYGPGPEFFRRDINRFFETTGVCWNFPQPWA